eukprot:5553955-Amphidinium_carterae.1
MEIEVEPSTNKWIVHQQPYVMETLNKFCPNLVLRKRTTPGDPEGYNPPTSAKTPDPNDAPSPTTQL